MNYIKRLEEENRSLASKLACIANDLNHFQAFLQTSRKFQNEPGQERKDWISTTDVINRIQEIKSII